MRRGSQQVTGCRKPSYLLEEAASNPVTCSEGRQARRDGRQVHSAKDSISQDALGPAQPAIQGPT
jgi:hypothetical protein